MTSKTDADASLIQNSIDDTIIMRDDSENLS
jgi:hypothetical protein